jgi:hypothetical protein
MIQRYEHHEGYSSMFMERDGDYVKYDDHQKAMDELLQTVFDKTQETAELQRQLTESQNARVAAFAREYGKGKY